MKDLNIAITLNKGVAGVINDMNTLNFTDGLLALNRFFGISMKALAEHTGINYNTMRVMCSLQDKMITDERCAEAIEVLKAVYIGK